MSSIEDDVRGQIEELNRELEVVEVNSNRMLDFLNSLITTGSKRFQVFKADLTIYAPDKETKQTVRLATLMKAGTCFFDACYFMSMNPDDRPDMNPAMDKGDKNKPTIRDAARALYFIYFVLMTRGTYPADGPIVGNTQIPAFLHKIMMFGGNIDKQYKTVASFDIQKIGTRWIKFIIIPNLAQETQQRFALQFPGYRLFQPFRFEDPDLDIPDHLRNLVFIIRTFLNRGYFWEIHSATRSSSTLAKFGAFNSNLSNLLLRCYSKAKLDEMVKARLIFQYPQFTYGRKNYESWTQEMFAEINDSIFPANTPATTSVSLAPPPRTAL